MTATDRDAGAAVASDDQLMAQIQAGSAGALGELYDRYCERAYRIAFVVCRDSGLAQKTVQNAFLSVWNGRESHPEPRGGVAAWLLKCVRHEAIKLKQVAGSARAEQLPALLDLLAEPQREVITLALYGGLLHTEIAAQLHLPTGAVKELMRLGLHKLREAAEYGTAAPAARPRSSRATTNLRADRGDRI